MTTREIHRQPPMPKDLRYSAVDMSVREAQYLVKEALSWKGLRQAAKNHQRILEKYHESHEAVKFVMNSTRVLGRNITNFLDIWTDNFPAAKWVKSLRGLGPLIAGGLAAYIDIEKAQKPSSVWKYAGFTPNSKRVSIKAADALLGASMDKIGDVVTVEHIVYIAEELGQDPKKALRFCKQHTWKKLDAYIRSPNYEPTLRKICLAAGKQFEWQRACPYHSVIKYYREIDDAKNAAGVFTEKAAGILEKFNYSKTTKAYQAYIQGKLPPAHLNVRAKSKAIKVFLAHYWQVLYYATYKETPPECYAVDVLKSTRRIVAPNQGAIEK